MKGNQSMFGKHFNLVLILTMLAWIAYTLPQVRAAFSGNPAEEFTGAVKSASVFSAGNSVSTGTVGLSISDISKVKSIYKVGDFVTVKFKVNRTDGGPVDLANHFYIDAGIYYAESGIKTTDSYLATANVTYLGNNYWSVQRSVPPQEGNYSLRITAGCYYEGSCSSNIPSWTVSPDYNVKFNVRGTSDIKVTSNLTYLNSNQTEARYSAVAEPSKGNKKVSYWNLVAICDPGVVGINGEEVCGKSRIENSSYGASLFQASLKNISSSKTVVRLVVAGYSSKEELLGIFEEKFVLNSSTGSTIFSISPSTAAAGSLITLNGTNFAGGSYVKITGKAYETSVIPSTITENKITFILPDVSAGTFDVQVGLKDVLSNAVQLNVTICYWFSTNLTLNDTGYEVAMLQDQLMVRGYDIPSISSGASSKGTYDQDTANAVSAFQAAQGIPATGQFGVLTRQLMNSSCQ